MSLKNQDFLLTANKFEIPASIQNCSGIQFGNKRVKSILLSTDLAHIQNIATDAVMTINPFVKSNRLDRFIIEFSSSPVFCDVGGGLFREENTIRLSKNAFKDGAAGVVISRPTSPENIFQMRKEISGTLIYTVMFDSEPVCDLRDAGIDIFNVVTGETTAESVQKIRETLPDTPLMASGGPYDFTISETIRMGADAIVFNPPTATEILRSIFDKYRNGIL